MMNSTEEDKFIEELTDSIIEGAVRGAVKEKLVIFTRVVIIAICFISILYFLRWGGLNG